MLISISFIFQFQKSFVQFRPKNHLALKYISARTVFSFYFFPGVETPGYQTVAPTELNRILQSTLCTL